MDDLISRKQAIDAFNPDHHVDWYTPWIVQTLEELPSVQPERKNGKWIKDDGDWFETMFRCSVCGALIRKQDKFRSFFCYHCGADMRGEQDDNRRV